MRHGAIGIDLGLRLLVTACPNAQRQFRIVIKHSQEIILLSGDCVRQEH
jgi:hypothetical protein